MGKILASEDFQTLSAQFVLLKIDAGSDENKLWEQFHKEKGNAIPQVYIIRSDGTELYNEIGGLGDQALKKLMEESLEKAGKPVDIKIAKQLTLTADKMKRMITSKKFGNAAELLKSSSEIEPMSRESFAMSAVYFRTVREQLDASLQKELTRLKEKVSQSSSASVKQKVQLVESATTLLNQIAGLEGTASDAEALKDEMKAQLSGTVQDLELAAASDTSPAVLEQIKERYAGTVVAKRIEARSRRETTKSLMSASDDSFDSEWTDIPNQKPRDWTSEGGNFSVNATLLAISAESVKLEKKDGSKIKVPLSKLSKTDLALLESIRKNKND